MHKAGWLQVMTIPVEIGRRNVVYGAGFHCKGHVLVELISFNDHPSKQYQKLNSEVRRCFINATS